jgi:hypothetical protein
MSVSEKIYMAADLRGPRNVWESTATNIATGPDQVIKKYQAPHAEIVALVVTTGASQQFDLQATGFFGDATYQQRFVRIISESAGDIWYAWHRSTGTTLNFNATGGATGVAAFLPSKTYTDELPGGRYLSIQSILVGVVRLWITNRTE